MATSTRKPKPQDAAAGAAWVPVAGETGIRVRMYRVGFGDFFLISLLDDNGAPQHIVIDCGVFKGTSQTGDIHSIEAAVAHMAKATGGRVALIVMTHRHADHIAGFARCADLFAAMRVDAVWMPVWESEYDAQALAFQAQLTQVALDLRQHFSALGAAASPEENTARKYMENATGELAAAAAAAGSNAKALDLLKNGLGVKPDYYQRGDKAKLPQALADAGLRCQVLGPPPITAADLMKLMDLTKGVGQYLGKDAAGGNGTRAPFAPKWDVEPADVLKDDEKPVYPDLAFREWVWPRKSWQDVTLDEARPVRQTMEDKLKRWNPATALLAAKKLNAFLNNQSLVLLFTFKGKKLLFVGDAQAGNWEHWLFDTDQPDKKASGRLAKSAEQILSSIDFYKVGHHGSSNATPKRAVAAMAATGRKFAAMCSTEADVYGTEDPDDPAKGTEVPRGPLLDALGAAAALVRSDQIAIKVDGKKIDAQAPKALPAAAPGRRFDKGELWIDCYL
ncbi:MAG TPA: hypothetical protein VEQ87_04840 [Burkholderiales bacterium]|nr:hypothetical protein [Burkholderiales bacterium]